MIVKKLNRRMRCEIQGCHKVAYVGLGTKGNDYPLCKDHFISLVKDGLDVLADDGIKLVNPEIVEKVVKVEPVKETPEEEFYVCKYCGEKFSKNEYTSGQFMAHCRKCKKEHETEE